MTVSHCVQLLTLLDVSDPASPTLAGHYELPADATDVETCDGLMAVSLENPDASTGLGSVAFFTIAVGAPHIVLVCSTWFPFLAICSSLKPQRFQACEVTVPNTPAVLPLAHALMRRMFFSTLPR